MMATEAIFYPPEPPAEPAAAEQPDGLYVHNADMTTEAVDAFISFFKTPRWKELLSILIQEVQEVEDANWLMHNAFDPDTAVGDQLDIIGRDVGELRNDRDDDDYRVAIQVRILVSQSDGKLEQLIAVVGTADATLTSEAREYYPASILFRWAGAFPTLHPSDIMRLVQQAKRGGVLVQAVVRNPATGFLWGAVADAGDASTHGFSKVDGTGGGVLEDVY